MLAEHCDVSVMQVGLIFKKYDRNRDQMIDEKEFKAFMGAVSAILDIIPYRSSLSVALTRWLAFAPQILSTEAMCEGQEESEIQRRVAKKLLLKTSDTRKFTRVKKNQVAPDDRSRRAQPPR